VPGGAHKRSDGVSCEHCHGPAENWLKAHVERDWPQKKAQYLSRGFYDNNNLELRARKCASCHVDIDHEIVAGGHPPLQYELVAYAQIMKHWDDQDELPAGAFSVDPTIWSLGQLAGLRRTLAMIARRAGAGDYASFGKFPHFADRNCYQCHHKLVDDALRQALGHYSMVDAVFAVVAPGQRDDLGGQWNGVASGVASSAEVARQRASALESWLAPYEDRIRQQRLDRDAARKILARVTSGGDRCKRIERFFFRRSPTSNVVEVGSVSAPWWWTTGCPEQTVLAIQSLCDPVYGAQRCRGIDPDIDRMLKAVDRFDYRADDFGAALGAIDAKLR
jgi:hypothetical protein